MTALTAERPAMVEAKRSIQGIAERLREERQALVSEMGAFLDGDWTGRAAVAFRAAFEEWSVGAADLLAGLEHTGALIGATLTLFGESDADVDRDLDRLVQRLGLV